LLDLLPTGSGFVLDTTTATGWWFDAKAVEQISLHDCPDVPARTFRLGLYGELCLLGLCSEPLTAYDARLSLYR